jgi:hypothetical protein
MFVRCDVCLLVDETHFQRLFESHIHKVVIVVKSKLSQRYQMVQCNPNFALNPLLSDF